MKFTKRLVQPVIPGEKRESERVTIAQENRPVIAESSNINTPVSPDGSGVVASNIRGGGYNSLPVQDPSLGLRFCMVAVGTYPVLDRQVGVERGRGRPSPLKTAALSGLPDAGFESLLTDRTEYRVPPPVTNGGAAPFSGASSTSSGDAI